MYLNDYLYICIYIYIHTHVCRVVYLQVRKLYIVHLFLQQFLTSSVKAVFALLSGHNMKSDLLGWWIQCADHAANKSLSIKKMFQIHQPLHILCCSQNPTAGSFFDEQRMWVESALPHTWTNGTAHMHAHTY